MALSFHIFEKNTKKKYNTLLADPPWRCYDRTGKIAPENKRLYRYSTMETNDIMSLPVRSVMYEHSHIYLWVPNALIADGLMVMKAWGFNYKTNIVWQKIRKDGEPDGRGVGFYFRNTTELLLFGVRGRRRTLQPGRSQVNVIKSPRLEHSRKPEEQYAIIESCSEGPYLELFARRDRENWTCWGDEVK